MSFSLDTPSAQTLKSEARLLREEREKAGASLSHGAALEEVARAHGFRDWNTARAMLPDRVVAPFGIGQRVAGTYLGQPFRGMLIGVQLLSDMRSYRLTVTFDTPVNVTPTFMFATLRQRIVTTVDQHGQSLALRGDGTPQTIIRRD
jgi:hypothetical protein